MRHPTTRSSSPALPRDGSEALKLTKTQVTGKKTPGRKAKKSRKGSGARLPGMKGGALLEDAPRRKPYQGKDPGFPLGRDEVILLCQEKHEPLFCAGQVLALMDLMEAAKCTMHHLHELTKIGYATIYSFLKLESFPSTPVMIKWVLALGCEYVEFAIIAHFNVLACQGA